jgi:hypothetical protein
VLRRGRGPVVQDTPKTQAALTCAVLGAADGSSEEFTAIAAQSLREGPAEAHSEEAVQLAAWEDEGGTTDTSQRAFVRQHAKPQ